MTLGYRSLPLHYNSKHENVLNRASLLIIIYSLGYRFTGYLIRNMWQSSKHWTPRIPENWVIEHPSHHIRKCLVLPYGNHIWLRISKHCVLSFNTTILKESSKMSNFQSHYTFIVITTFFMSVTLLIPLPNLNLTMILKILKYSKHRNFYVKVLPNNIKNNYPLNNENSENHPK